MRLLVLGLRGDMASWAGPAIDGYPLALPIPGASAITGMLGAALGIDRAEHERLQALQDGLEHAVVVHAGEPLVDFQTADLSTPHMRGPFMTGSGRIVAREGSEDALAKRIVRRPYLSGFVADVVLTLAPDAGPTVEDLAAALLRPAYPVTLGRRCCPPSAPILGTIVEAASLEVAARERLRPGSVLWLPAAMGEHGTITVADRRDWRTRASWRPSAWRRVAGVAACT
jgi:CRISPR system Cascade subunit CasD